MKILLLCLLCLAIPAYAAADAPSEGKPSVGSKIPAFSMQGSDGQTYTNESLSGKNFVIAFFPKAFTGG